MKKKRSVQKEIRRNFSERPAPMDPYKDYPISLYPEMTVSCPKISQI